MMSPSERAAFDAMANALRLIEWGNSGFVEDTCPRCGRIPKKGHLDWCQISVALDLERKASSADDPAGE